MKVQDTYRDERWPNYRLEFGISSWSQDKPTELQNESVRNRYDLDDGRFSPHQSSEIPLGDIPLILRECLLRDKIGVPELLQMLHHISDSIERQSNL
jgi:hypothetical protein